MSSVQSVQNDTIEKLCQQLDSLVLKYFEALAELNNTKQQLEHAMKDGYLFMAKARYSMGVTSISSLQYNEKDLEEAIVHVAVESQDDPAAGSHQFVPHFASSSNAATLYKTQDHTSSPITLTPSNGNDDSTDLASSVSQLNIGLGLRKRNIPADKISDNDAVDESRAKQDGKEKHDDDDDDRSKAAVRDPIRWFGVLVPRPLRQSQQAFRNGIELACKVATLQSNVMDIRQSYGSLLKEKRQLLEANKV